jgi:hypothetical protein
MYQLILIKREIGLLISEKTTYVCNGINRLSDVQRKSKA